MRIGSLFSGAGGLDMAVEAVFGGRTVWHSEIDKAASKVLAHRWPDVPNLGSITEIDWATVEPVDVLCGGFPCQDVSAAGKRAGIKDGTRSGLWAIFAEAIDWLHPQYVVIENVRGLLSAAAHRTVEDDAGDYLEPGPAGVGDGASRPVLRAAGAVLGDLADLGYDCRWTTLAASAVGAPHRRERVFIVASSGNTHAGRRKVSTTYAAPQDSLAVSVALLPTPSTHDKTGARSPESIARMDKAFANLNDTVVNELRVDRGHKPVEVIGGEDDGAVPVLAADGGGDDAFLIALNGDGIAVDVRGAENSHSSYVPAELAGTKSNFGDLLPTPEAKNSHAGPDYARMNREGSGGHDLVTAITLLSTPTAQPGGSRSGNRIGEPLLRHQAREMETAWGKYAPAIRRWEQIVGPAPAPTEPNKNNNPRLSAAFSEWLMGWPAGWVTDPAIGISRNDQLRIVGNGVCTQQAIAALRYLLTVTA